MHDVGLLQQRVASSSACWQTCKSWVGLPVVVVAGLAVEVFAGAAFGLAGSSGTEVPVAGVIFGAAVAVSSGCSFFHAGTSSSLPQPAALSQPFERQ